MPAAAKTEAVAHNAELGIHDQRICDDYIQGILLTGDMQGCKHQMCGAGIGVEPGKANENAETVV